MLRNYRPVTRRSPLFLPRTGASSHSVIGPRSRFNTVVRALILAVAVVAAGCASVDSPRGSIEDGAAVSASALAAGVTLRGPWRAYEGVLLDPDDLLPSEPSFRISLPSEVQDGDYPAPGFRAGPGPRSLVFDFDLPASADTLGLKFYRVWGASRFICRIGASAGGAGGRVDYAMGEPGFTRATSFNLHRWGVVPLPPGGHAHCVMQLANFEGNPGMSDAPVLGFHHALQASWSRHLSVDTSLFGILIAFAAYHLVLFRSRGDRSYLYFAITSFAIAARAFVSARIFEVSFPGSHAADLIWGVDIGAIAIGSAGGMAFVAEILRGHFPRNFTDIYFPIGVVLTVLTFLRRWLIPSQSILLIDEVYFVIGVVFALRAMFRAFRQGGVPDLGLLFGGIGLAMLAGVYEIFSGRNMLPAIPAMDFGILMFVSCEGLLLVRRTERMHVATEHLARELEHKNDALARAALERDAFVAATSHELKTPLHGMIGLMEGVRDDLPERSRQSIDIAVASGRRLETQINGLLDFAQLRRDELTLDRRPIDTDALVRAVVETSRAIAGARELQFTTSISRGILPIFGDESRVRQVLFHVIGNAVKFTDRGSIAVSALSHGSLVEIAVSDTGRGIAEEYQSRVFEAFTQESLVDTRQAGGTGLGLAISQRLMELHGGSIRLESRLGTGTVVTLAFPAASEPARSREELLVIAPLPVEFSSPEMAPSGLGPVSAIFDRRSLSIITAAGDRDDRLSILAVDDDPVNLRVLSTQLRPGGYRVVLASNGAEALDTYASDGPFDLVLLDVMMPIMSGLEALRVFRKSATQADLPVILLTAKQQPDDVLAGFDAGANDYLTKPFSKKELIARIETHLTIAKTNQALRRFVPQEFLEALGRRNVTEVRLGDSVERRLAILFGDIRGFTRISEGLGPEKTFRFVNQCLQRITPWVRANHGFIDKFVGDAVLAIFPRDSYSAVDAAIAIQRAIDDAAVLDETAAFSFGIGIHVGPTMMGTIGDERRLEATVISDAVNQAARLEGMTKHVGARILVSGDVAAEIGASYTLRRLGPMRAVGKEKPIEVVEVLDGDPGDLREKKLAMRPRFDAGLRALSGGSFAEAAAIFEALHGEESRDGAVAFFLAAAADAVAGLPVVEGGVVILNRK